MPPAHQTLLVQASTRTESHLRRGPASESKSAGLRLMLRKPLLDWYKSPAFPVAGWLSPHRLPHPQLCSRTLSHSHAYNTPCSAATSAPGLSRPSAQ